jgi:hypothetical protein
LDIGDTVVVPTGLTFTFCGILEPVTNTYTYRSPTRSFCGLANASVVATANTNSKTPAFASFDVFIIWNLETFSFSIVNLFNPEHKGEFRRRFHKSSRPKLEHNGAETHFARESRELTPMNRVRSFFRALSRDSQAAYPLFPSFPSVEMQRGTEQKQTKKTKFLRETPYGQKRQPRKRSGLPLC